MENIWKLVSECRCLRTLFQPTVSISYILSVAGLLPLQHAKTKEPCLVPVLWRAPVGLVPSTILAMGCWYLYMRGQQCNYFTLSRILWHVSRFRLALPSSPVESWVWGPLKANIVSFSF